MADIIGFIGLARSTPECGQCGSKNVQTRREQETFPYGTGDEATEITVNVPVHTCGDCGFVFTDDVADQIRHDAVCQHLGVLAPSEITEIREAYGVSRAEFARISRIGEASINRWENGALIQNAAMDQYLFLLKLERNFTLVRDRGKEPDLVPRVEVGRKVWESEPSFVVLKAAGMEAARHQAEQFAL